MFPGWSILGWKCGVYHGNKYALDNGILSMGKSMIFGFRVYDRSEDSRIYCHHLLEAPSLNTIALVTLELLHRPISENNIDYKGRVLLAANTDWRQHWKHCGEPCLLGLFPPLFLFISRVLQIFSSNHLAKWFAKWFEEIQSFWIVVLNISSSPLTVAVYFLNDTPRSEW